MTHGELDRIITDYVGVDDDGRSLDPVVHDSIVEECTKHYDCVKPFNRLSTDAKKCVEEFNQYLKHRGCSSCSNYEEYQAPTKGGKR